MNEEELVLEALRNKPFMTTEEIAQVTNLTCYRVLSRLAWLQSRHQVMVMSAKVHSKGVYDLIWSFVFQP